MSPNTNKPKTGSRRFRGLEVAQAALLLVLGVVVAMVMYFVMTNMLASAPVPEVQLDPYNTVVVQTHASVSLYFGTSAVVAGVDVITSDDTTPIASCVPVLGSSYPVRVVPGKKYVFDCSLLDAGKSWPRHAILRVWFAGDGHRVAHLHWLIG